MYAVQPRNLPVCLLLIFVVVEADFVFDALRRFFFVVVLAPVRSQYLSDIGYLLNTHLDRQK